MSIEDFAKASVPFFGWITSVVGWAIGLIQWRKKRRVETELKLIRRRGEAPYLTPSNIPFEHLYFSLKPGEVRILPAGSPNLLCFLRDEVERTVPEKTPIMFVVDNQGRAARRVSLSLDGVSIQLR